MRRLRRLKTLRPPAQPFRDEPHRQPQRCNTKPECLQAPEAGPRYMSMSSEPVSLKNSSSEAIMVTVRMVESAAAVP